MQSLFTVLIAALAGCLALFMLETEEHQVVEQEIAQTEIPAES